MVLICTVAGINLSSLVSDETHRFTLLLNSVFIIVDLPKPDVPLKIYRKSSIILLAESERQLY